MEQDDSFKMNIIHEVLKASSSGPFFPDWEFHTLFGLNREEVKEIADNWPNANDFDYLNLAINNSFVNLLGYPIDNESEWSKYISVSRDELNKYYSSWRQETNRNKLDTDKKQYFSGLE